MPTYIALLRSVNVANTTLKMEQLRSWLDELGFADVRTYIQSGNAIFRADQPASRCAEVITACIAAGLGAPVAVLLRTADELAAVVAHNPFLRSGAIDRSRLHVTFLAAAPEQAGMEKLGRIKAEPDEFRASGREIYLHCPGGYGRTKLSNQAIERALSVPATTRNWNTVTKLHELASG